MYDYCNELQNEYLEIDEDKYTFKRNYIQDGKSILDIAFSNPHSETRVSIVCGNVSNPLITSDDFFKYLHGLYHSHLKRLECNPTQTDVCLVGDAKEADGSQLSKGCPFYFGIKPIDKAEKGNLTYAYQTIADCVRKAAKLHSSFDEDAFRGVDMKVGMCQYAERNLHLPEDGKEIEKLNINIFQKEDVDKRSAFAPLYEGVKDESQYHGINIILFLPERYYNVFRSQTHCTPSFIKFVFLSQNPEVVAVKKQMGQQLKEGNEKSAAAEARAAAAEARAAAAEARAAAAEARAAAAEARAAAVEARAAAVEAERDELKRKLNLQVNDYDNVQPKRENNTEKEQYEESFTSFNQETKDFEPGQSADKTNDATILPEKYVPADKSKTSENSDVLVDVTLEDSQTTTQENTLNMESVKQETVKSASMLQNRPKAKETTQTIPQANQTTALENNKTRGR